MSEDAIGGYLALEWPDGRHEWHRDAMRFQSARAGLLALLRARVPSAVWAPWYLCDSMIEPLRAARIPVRRYALNRDLGCPTITLGDDEWLLYVNYFGVCERHVDDTLSRHPRERVVIDNAHAFFSEPRDCLATIYSPRKFVGVPDGGYLVSRVHVPVPEVSDDHSLARCRHLLARLATGAEAGYADFASAEASLQQQEPQRMSTLTQRLLAGIDYDTVRAKRIANFNYLNENLGSRNRLPLVSVPDCAPLCYPFVGAPRGLRDQWRRQRIYSATYWPDLPPDPDMPDFERNLPHDTLFVPCDQRLSPEQLKPLVNQILEQCRR
ncbi:TPA: hypothetical protein QDC55_005996 [Burkholderia cenocepacia]|nr:hypothetical protein [Burkholderia cenocepacia]HDR9808163.1 hypothetical protein [Burkholderia cenocepacia]HDR9814999.1 hypothetical protein [Burkholderia cenocepacia]HDR9821453.1 hypothetical protein [Burkholderia cenocepacia]HDR9832387.1 hypothetical protein [Burkholderia cenocepacia]